MSSSCSSTMPASLSNNSCSMKNFFPRTFQCACFACEYRSLKSARPWFNNATTCSLAFAGRSLTVARSLVLLMLCRGLSVAFSHHKIHRAEDGHDVAHHVARQKRGQDAEVHERRGAN